MAQWKMLLFPFLFLLLLKSALVTGDMCYEVDIKDPCIVALPVNAKQGTEMTMEECIKHCRWDRFYYAALSEKKFCHCLQEDGLSDCTLEDSSSSCTDIHPKYFTVDIAGGGSLDFSFTATSLEDELELSITNKESKFLSLTVDLGDGSEPIIISDTTVVDTFEIKDFVIAGNYSIAVTSFIEGMLGNHTEIVNVTYNYLHNDETIRSVDCPVVAEPEIEYYCNVSMLVLPYESESATFVEPTVEHKLGDIVIDTYRVGIAPPRDPEGLYKHYSAVQGSTDFDIIFKFQEPIEDTVETTYFEVYLYEDGSVTYGHVSPSCTGGLLYCHALKGCAETCPYDAESRSYTCGGKLLFCSQSETCVTSYFTDKCPKSTEEATYTDLSTSTVSLYKGYNRVTWETTLNPGDIILAKGPISRRKLLSPGGDTINGEMTEFRHLFSAIYEKDNRFQISHTCSFPGQFVSLTALTYTSEISCERRIKDIALNISQKEVDTFDPTLNIEEPFYASSDHPMNYTAIFSTSGPISITFIHVSPDNSFNETFNDTTDYPVGLFPHELHFSVNTSIAGRYNITTMALNRHSMETGIIQNSTILYVQYPVLSTWLIRPVPRDEEAFKIPTEDAVFEFEETTEADFPTDAYIDVSWGDGTGNETFPFKGPDPNITHKYSAGGIYFVTARIYNNVSDVVVDGTVTIIEEIKDFRVVPMYYPTDDSPNARVGYGLDGYMFPLDKPTSFFPDMTQGSVETYKIKLAATGEVLHTFTTVDQFEPLADDFGYYFNEENSFNITVTANNVFEEVAFNLEVDIVAMIRGGKIDDAAIVTTKGKRKYFTADFQTMASSDSCMLVSWGDYSPEATYGDLTTCNNEFDWAVHQSDELNLHNEFSHIYKDNGIYNISILAFNKISKVRDILMFVVTDIPCNPPKVRVIDGVGFYLEAKRYKRSEIINIATEAEVNCEVTSKTKKRWQIFRLEPHLGDFRTPVLFLETIPSSDKSELTIPPLFLEYGYYQVVFTLSMYDPTVLDKFWPFEKAASTVIEVVKSEVIPMALEGGVSKIVRGRKQSVSFRPGFHSVDPDFPDEKIFSITWKCKKASETWPPEDNDDPKPIFPQGTRTIGCFGYGPGLLDFSDTFLILMGNDFIGNGGTFDLLMIIEKDSRKSETTVQIVITPEDVPFVGIKCLTEEFCKYTSKGMYVNPNYQLDTTMDCENDCFSPLTYEWIMTNDNGAQIPSTDNYFPFGTRGIELAVSPTVFQDNPSMDSFSLAGTVTNNEGLTGKSAFSISVNEAPTGGTCNLIIPDPPKALIGPFRLECSGWTDREELRISYEMYLERKDPYEIIAITTFAHYSQAVQATNMTLPPGTFKVIVKILDEWQAYTEVVLHENLEILMLTADEYDDALVAPTMQRMGGEGKMASLNMYVGALTSVMNEAEWMQTENKTDEEIDDILLLLDGHNNIGLNTILENTNFNSLQVIETTSSTVASVLKTASKNLEILKSISIESRDTIIDLMETMMDNVEKHDIIAPTQLQSIGTNLASIASNAMLGIFEIGTDTKCKKAPPSDVRDSDKLPFDTDIGTDINMKIPASDLGIRKCNVRDVTKEKAAYQVPRMEKVVHDMAQSMIKRSLVDESWNLSDPNGMCVHASLVKLNQSDWSHHFGEEKGKVTLPGGMCPTGVCGEAVGITAISWPTLTHSYTEKALNLALGTRVLDLTLSDRDGVPLVVKNVDPPIRMTIPRTLGKMGENTLPEPMFVSTEDNVTESSIPVIYSMFNVTTNFSSFNVEIKTESRNDRMFMIISPKRVPTITEYQWFAMIKDIDIVENGVRNYFVPSTETNGTGRYFIGLGEFKDDVDWANMNRLINISDLQNVSTNYDMRVYTSSCSFFSEEEGEWVWEKYVQVKRSTHRETECHSNHLTSFGAGFVVAPNTLDFSFIFANMGFEDNLTIYLTLIISLSIFVCLLIWARYMDRKDLTKLGAAPLPDNRVQDKYLYEVLVFTSNIKGAQTKSTVQFILSGTTAETDVRTFGDEQRKIMRKSGTDVFVMAVPRHLGKLEFLRIWHDNSGKGINGSWHLSYIVFRDVQTGEKFEFIANKWFALEKDDGQIERMIPVAGKIEKSQFRHIFNTTTNKDIADGHLWFSVFLRPPRSRFTRCQRVASCFALLFLSMLVNAMWYERVPEQPGTGGLNFGPFNLSPEQLGVGFLSNLIVFPPSFLIVFLFRKARPSNLRPSRIQLAVARTRNEFRAKNVDASVLEKEENKNDAYVPPDRKEDESKKKKKKMTLPPFFRYLAWLLVLVCIGASCFFLLMYGVMFGNSKATKWVTSLIISFFSSVLFVQPVKIFLIAFIVSTVFKTGDHDEDDSDEDEEDPYLTRGEEWMYDDTERVANRIESEEDRKKMDALRKLRKQEIGMSEILKEIILYAIFICILLILSHGNRDPNAFYLQKSLRHAFLYEGSLSGEDFTKVKTTNRLWYYLFNGLLQKLRADTLYNGKPPYGLRGYLEDHANRIIGYATIRQIRAKSNSCSFPETMENFTDGCTSYSSIFNEERNDYCAGWTIPTPDLNKDLCEPGEWKYSTAEKMEGYPIWGQMDWYSGGGYVIHLQGPTETLLEKFAKLQEQHWIDKYTRAVLIEFSSYNPGVNLFGMSLLMAEYTPGGGITPSFRFEGINLLQHHNRMGGFIVFCEVLFILFIIGYTVKESRAMCRMGKEYVKNYWSYAEIAIIVTSYVMMAIYILRYNATKEVLEVFQKTFGNGYVNLSYAALLNEIYLYLVSFIGFVGSLKFIKLLRFNKKIGILSVTLRQCWEDLTGFLMAFFLCFFSFVNMFYLLLNMHLEGFYNFIVSVETCFSMMLGKFQFEKMKEASMIVPLMFFIFVVFNSWVLINLLLTVIIQAFVEIKHDLMKQPNEYEIVDYVWGRFRKFIGFRPRENSNCPQGNDQKDDGDYAMSPEKRDERLNEFPEKMDKFLEYINNLYFDGNLDYSKKASRYYNKPPVRASGIRNGDTEKMKGSPSDPFRLIADDDYSFLRGPGNNRRSNNRWAGADDDEDYSSRFFARNNSDRGRVYNGPRIRNKFQAELDDF